MRLIDADALKTIKSIQSADFNSIETIRKWIDSAPTIDAVPVVRCERIVKLINDLIDNAVHHGADCGGAYFINEEGLIESAQNLLDALNLKGRYEVKELPGWHDSWSDIAVSEKGDAG